MTESEWTKDSRMAGLPGVSKRDQRSGQDSAFVGAAEGWNSKLVCSGCGKRVYAIVKTYEREVRDLPCFEYRTTVVIELYRVRCPDCGIQREKVEIAPERLLRALLLQVFYSVRSAAERPPWKTPRPVPPAFPTFPPLRRRLQWRFVVFLSEQSQGADQ